MMFYDSLFPYTLVLRAKLGVQNSIKYGRIFHMFMHPEDFVIDASLLGKLEQVLEFVSQKKDEKNIEVITMRDLAFILNKKL